MGLGGIAAGIGAAATAASAANSIIGGSNAAQQAGQVQNAAAQQAADDTMQMFNTTQANLQPFISQGTTGNALLGYLTGANSNLPAGTTSPKGIGTGTLASGGLLASPQAWNPTMAGLAATPGYQFTLQQGLQAAQNGFAAQGLGSSGAAEKGAINYAEGLAGTTYQQQFQNYLSQSQLQLANQQQQYNMLGGLAQSGQNAAANLGNTGLNSTGQAGGFSTSGAAAQAAGIVGAQNATASGLNALGGLGTSGLQYALLSGNNSGASPGNASLGSTLSGAASLDPSTLQNILNVPSNVYVP